MECQTSDLNSVSRVVTYERQPSLNKNTSKTTNNPQFSHHVSHDPLRSKRLVSDARETNSSELILIGESKEVEVDI